MKILKSKCMQEEAAAETPPAVSVTVPVSETPETTDVLTDSAINELIQGEGDFESGDESVEDAPVAEETPAEKTETPAEQVTEESETPAETPEAEEGETETPAEETPVPEQETEEPPQPAAESQLTPEEAQANREKVEAELRTALEDVYAFSDEDATALAVEPEKVLPKLAANLHVSVLQAATQGVIAQLPGLIDAVMKGREVSSQAEDAFYGKWPKLKGHEDTVMRITQTYRALNPGAPMEQAIQEIGTQAMFMLRIPMDDAPAETVTTPQATTPPTPASPGSSTVAPVIPPASDNPFTQMAEEFIEED